MQTKSKELDFSQATQAGQSITQGSNLGPLLFLIDIYDLLDACTIDSDLYVYAD